MDVRGSLSLYSLDPDKLKKNYFYAGSTDLVHVVKVQPSEGLSETALHLTAADTVIHFDPWWNPAAEAQATDRAYRIGQDKPVFAYKLIAAESVEERVLQMQERKKGLIEGLLGDQKAALKKWDEADLEDLFKPIG